MLRAVLLDVGGTLWPDQLTGYTDSAVCEQRLSQLLPAIAPARALVTLRDSLQQALAAADRAGAYRQDLDRLLARAVATLGVEPAELDLVALRRALCAPVVPGVQVFPGARELLDAIRTLGLRCVVVSNVQVRGAVEYWQDFADLGIAQLIDAVVTSLDVGFRKPHPAIFEVVLREAGCAPAACVMVGNSEVNDIQPAVALGLRTIRVAIEEPLPAASAAQAVVSSLHDVRELISHWTHGARPGVAPP